MRGTPSRRNWTRTRNRRSLDGFRSQEQSVDWITWAKEAGVYISPLLMGAVLWQEMERRRLIADNKELNLHLRDLAKQVVTVSTELKIFLFNERKA